MNNIRKALSTGIFATIMATGVAIPVNEANAFEFEFPRNSGFRWQTKDSGTSRVGPGNNFFSSANVEVREDGVHLFIRPVNGRLSCAEIIGLQTTGHGLYTWRLGTPIDTISAVDFVILGMFTWSNTGSNTELDAEVGEFREGTNYLHSVQPNSQFYFIEGPAWNTSTHSILWQRRSATITGTPGGGGNSIVSTFSRPPRPNRGTSARVNLWLRDGQIPGNLPPGGLEVVITEFSYDRR
jgi:hypothetical protein